MIISNKINNQAEINTIIFDIDGTITRWKNVAEFLEKALSSLGMPYKEEYLDGLYKAMQLRELHALTTGEADEDVYSMLLEEYITDLKKYNVSGEKLKSRMFELEASETFIEDDVLQELSELSKNYQLYCYTNWFKQQAIKKLDRYGLTEYFKQIYASDDNYVKFTKVGFLYLLDKENLVVRNTVHIGDSKNDIIPSHRSGVNSIFLDYTIDSLDNIGSEQMNLINICDASITEFSDIRKVLKKVNTNF